MTTKCDHTEAIARDMYTTYTNAVSGRAFNGDPLPAADEFFGDSTKQKQANAWRAVAKNALPIIGKHALGDIKNYLGDKASEESGLKKILLWLAAAVVGGLATLGLTGCGHDVHVTPDATVITKDGSAMVIRKGFFSFSQPTPSIIDPPVIVQKGK